MSIQDKISATGTPIVIDKPILSLDEIRERIKSANTFDESKCQTFYHPGLDSNLKIGPMSSQGYYAVENVAQYYPLNYSDPALRGRKASSQADDEQNQDIAYIQFGVLEPSLSKSDVVALLKMPGQGSANRELVNAIKAINPSREHLTPEVGAVWAWCSANVVFWRVIKECGLFKAVLDYIASDDSTEVQSAARELNKVFDSLPDWEKLFNSHQFAQLSNINIYPDNDYEPTQDEQIEAMNHVGVV